jgi:hypothetical protein
VVEFWRKGHLTLGTITISLQWVRRFRTYCVKRKLPETEHLTAVGVRRFASVYTGPRLRGRQSSQDSRNLASNAIHAWACALGTLGTTPPWDDKRALPLSPRSIAIIGKPTMGYRSRTLVRDVDVETARGFLGELRGRTSGHLCQTWTRLCGSLPLAFPNEPWQIPAGLYGVICGGASRVPGVMMTSPVDRSKTSYTRSGSRRI